MNDKTMRIWCFEDAPIDYQNLSTSGGDEDYIAFVPDGAYFDPLVESWFGSFDSKGHWNENNGHAFGCCSVDRFVVEGGLVFIGSHA